jgi:type I restriction enzyme S subunit
VARQLTLESWLWESADILDCMGAKASLLNERRENHQALERGLMEMLLTGEWRVKGDAEMAA